MPKITIDLDLGPNYGQDEDGDFYAIAPDYDAQIIDAIARRLIGDSEYSDRRQVFEKVYEAVDTIITQRVTELIDEALQEPFQKYDWNGKPTGDAFTIRQLIFAAVEKFANAPAGTNGYRSSSDPAKNLAELVNKAVDEALRTELSDDVQSIRRSVSDVIKQQLTGAVAEALGKVR